MICCVCNKEFKPQKSKQKCNKCYITEYCLKNKEKLQHQRKKWLENNQKKVIFQRTEYYKNNKEHVLKNQAQYRKENAEKILSYQKEYRKNNTKKIREKHKREQRKYRQNPGFKIKTNISRVIRTYLLKKDCSKNKKSCTKYLPYTIEELKTHIESQFEDWMNWDNHGKYNAKTWNDNDPSTWTWQIDHIIPHSYFNYSSMEDEEFKKCWALDNLRPYSAKQNILDGNRR